MLPAPAPLPHAVHDIPASAESAAIARLERDLAESRIENERLREKLKATVKRTSSTVHSSTGDDDTAAARAIAPLPRSSFLRNDHKPDDLRQAPLLFGASSNRLSQHMMKTHYPMYVGYLYEFRRADNNTILRPYSSHTATFPYPVLYPGRHVDILTCTRHCPTPAKILHVIRCPCLPVRSLTHTHEFPGRRSSVSVCFPPL
jgi:hypothetical protein